jgi:anti-sigma factor RsiW
VAEIAERCRAFDEDLSALIDRELGAERRAEVEAHLAACSGCSTRLAALRAVDRALASLPGPAVAPDLHARLARRLAAERRALRAGPPSLRSRRAVGILTLPAAAAAALALYLALRAPSPPGTASEPAAIAKAPPGEPAEPARSEPQASGVHRAGPVEPGGEPQVVAAEPETPAAEPLPSPPAPERERATRIADRAQPLPGEGELESLDTEDLAVVLDLDTIEDLPVIANLEVLERLLREDAG